MENASKALIIAGAILLSIAIIAIGMAVYNNAADSVSGTDMTSEQVTAYNSTFTSYEGSIRGSRAKTLVTTVRQHNLQASDDSEKIQVLTSGADNTEVAAGSFDPPSTSDLQTLANTLQSGKTYNVSFGYDPSSGMITTVYIVEQSS